jgi:hypothetical protein
LLDSFIEKSPAVEEWSKIGLEDKLARFLAETNQVCNPAATNATNVHLHCLASHYQRLMNSHSGPLDVPAWNKGQAN